MNDKLIAQLIKISPTGPDGFEGLIVRLLERLTGRKFYLARSGNQAGRDAGSDFAHGFIIAVECKRYGRETQFDERNVQGGLAQAIQTTPALDVWVLATSRDVTDQLYRSLQDQGEAAGVTIMPLASGLGEVGMLDALCASSIDIVIDAIRGQATEADTEADIESVGQELREIADRPEFGAVVQQLKDSFSSAHVGYPSWLAAQKHWLRHCFSSEPESRAHMGQLLNVADSSTLVIPRKDAWMKLDSWLAEWSQHPKFFIVTGEEGDGKTWAVASWVATRFAQDDVFPPVVFLPSEAASSTDPQTLIAQAIGAKLGRSLENRWAGRLENWLKRPESDCPLMLLVLDGINERYEARRWRRLFENLAVEPWRSRIAVIVTSRAGYWSEYFSVLRNIPHVTFELPPLSDQEVHFALARFGLDVSVFVDDLLPLLRKPRYLDRVVKHRERLEESGDYTPARLVYEDWLDRYQRKSGLPLNDDDFREVIRSLARKHREGIDLSRNELGQVLALYEAKKDVFRELETSGVLRSRDGHYHVDETLLAYGLGLLLADEALSAAGDPEVDVLELVAGWLEPYAEMDLKARIREVAALHALLVPGYSRKVRTLLLHFWLSSKNPGPEIEGHFTAYFPQQCRAYFDLAERVWLYPHDNLWAQELMMATLLKWKEANGLQPEFVDVFTRWLGFIHPSPHPFLGRPDDERIEKTRRDIAERLGHDLAPGPLYFHGYRLTVVEDVGLLRLGRVALGVVSTGSLEPFIQAIVTGCIADTIMGSHTLWELAAWVIRSAREPVWFRLEPEVESLLDVQHIVAQRAAYDLLAFIGNEDTHDLKQKFSLDPYPPTQFMLNLRSDPCHQFWEWTKDNLEECLQRSDIDPLSIARKLQRLCLEPGFTIPDDARTRLEEVTRTIAIERLWVAMGPTLEEGSLRDAEPALAALIPTALADMIRRTVNQVDQRSELPLRQLALRLPGHSLIFREEEWGRIRNVWSDLWSRYAELDSTDSETLMFMAPAILSHLNDRDQLDFLLMRPTNAPDYLRYEPTFRTVSEWDYVRTHLSGAADSHIKSILWFISASGASISSDVFDQVLQLLSHEDSLVRALTLKIIYYVSQAEDAASAVTRSEWSWDLQNTLEENSWGSLILCEYGEALPYQQLRDRVEPNLLGYAVAKRGLQPEEVNQYAQDINKVWRTLVGKASDLPADLPAAYVEVDRSLSQPSAIERVRLLRNASGGNYRLSARKAGPDDGREESPSVQVLTLSIEEMEEQDRQWLELIRQSIEQQAQVGNTWFSQRFAPHALEAVAVARPDLVQQWLGGGASDAKFVQSLLVKGRAFYESLCSVLLRVAPEEGIRLYQLLQENDAAIQFLFNRTKITLLDYALFSELTFEVGGDEWDRRLDQCRSDRELLEVTIIAQEGNGAEWLWQVIESSLNSDVLFRRARAYVLLGFFAAPEAGKALQNLVDELPDTWLGDLARRSQQLWQTNEWAKHWFGRFLETEDAVLAWASFRLFLRCTDTRFWSWRQQSLETFSDLPWTRERKVFLQNNLSDVENRIKENEKSIREQFLGQRLFQREAWPWLSMHIKPQSRQIIQES